MGAATAWRRSTAPPPGNTHLCTHNGTQTSRPGQALAARGTPGNGLRAGVRADLDCICDIIGVVCVSCPGNAIA